MTATSLDPNPLAIADHARASIEAHRAEAETGRRLPEALLTELKALGAFRLHNPREIGGFEANLTTALKLYESIARIDGSVAWNVWNGNIGFIAALLDADAVSKIWATGPDQVMANSARVTGMATPVDGGYRLSGRWDMVSGIDSADWCGLFAFEPSSGVLVFMLPKGDFLVEDTWHVGGMRGTGSKTVIVDDIFVATNLAVSPFAPAHIDRPLYRIAPFTLASTGAAGAILGMAQSSIDALIELAASKATDNDQTLAHRSHAQRAIGQATAALNAARLLVFDATGRIEAAAEATEPITAEHRAALRASMSHAAQVARDVTTAMYQLGSSSSLYVGNRLEQIFRDVHAATQHGLLNATFFELAARVQLGLDPGMPI